MSERHGLQAPHPPALVTVEAPLAADIVGRPGGLVNDGPPDGRFWDFATISVGTPVIELNDRQWPGLGFRQFIGLV